MPVALAVGNRAEAQKNSHNSLLPCMGSVELASIFPQ